MGLREQRFISYLISLYLLQHCTSSRHHNNIIIVLCLVQESFCNGARLDNDLIETPTEADNLSRTQKKKNCEVRRFPLDVN